ncbi:hypothetical protein I4P06_21290 [Enterobacter asburiae]|uniref:hypothetical protein n=1 Tax=Enterobacter asburiae TaxID=61645 RepID=UPI0018C20BFC|nr:hypothetical protein [Enterobacter asburiae]MBG0640523.1 hypothetical protein [Enterobacter asburiae]
MKAVFWRNARIRPPPPATISSKNHTARLQKRLTTAFQRSYGLSVKRLAAVIVVVDEWTNARKANLNRFTPSYLAFVARVKEKLVSAGLKISSPVRKLRQLVDRFFAPSPCQNDSPSRCKNDRAKNKRTPSRTIKRDLPGKPEMQAAVISNKQLSHSIAASKAAAASKRFQLANLYRHQQRDAIER